MTRGPRPAVLRAVETDRDGPPAPPGWLSREAKAAWRAVAGDLNARGLLGEADLPTLASYSIAQGQVAALARILRKEGSIIASKSGPRSHPAAAQLAAMLRSSRQLAAELGLSPLSRSRPGAAAAGGGDQWDGLLD